VLLPGKHHKSTGKAPQKTLPGTSKGTTVAPQKHYLSTIKSAAYPGKAAAFFDNNDKQSIFPKLPG
jgi:hypothetical protein